MLSPSLSCFFVVVFEREKNLCLPARLVCLYVLSLGLNISVKHVCPSCVSQYRLWTANRPRLGHAWLSVTSVGHDRHVQLSGHVRLLVTYISLGRGRTSVGDVYLSASSFLGLLLQLC